VSADILINYDDQFIALYNNVRGKNDPGSQMILAALLQADANHRLAQAVNDLVTKIAGTIPVEIVNALRMEVPDGK
jgi:hypothetical protein